MIQPILHKKQFNYVTSNSIPVEGSQAYSTLAQSNIPITKSGYLYVFVSNESSNVAVYFDNLNITHTKGALLEETHYYAYGLEIKGISSRAQGLAQNKIKYNKGTELETALDIDLYETPLRRLDAQLGRFTGVDIMATETYYLNPYHYATNNPISFNDPSGALSSAADMASARLQTGPDGRDHVGWMSEMMWGSPEFFSGGEFSGAGGGSGIFSNFWNDFLDKAEFGKNYDFNTLKTGVKNGKDGYWLNYTFETSFDANGTNLQSVGVGTTFVTFDLLNDKIKMPSFFKLWQNYPPDISPGNHAHPSKDGYENQCAIRLGYCFIKSGVSLKGYNTGPITTEGYPRGAKSLADWLWQNYKKPKVLSQKDFDTNYRYSKGIIFIQKANSNSADHIDLFNNGKTGSGYYAGSAIWFWEM